MKGNHFVNNEWIKGQGDQFNSINPSTNDIVWQGNKGTKSEINNAVASAKYAFLNWRENLEFRRNILKKFSKVLEAQKNNLANIISKETGKPLWESQTEINSMIQKIPLSLNAFEIRAKPMFSVDKEENLSIRFKPQGVLAVFAPFNFPAHLPNGHIIPALLSGNTIVLKPSELTPLVSEKIIECWEIAGLPKGVINLIQGDGKTGEILSTHPDINGLLFTGSYSTGKKIAEVLANTPEKILALEMGGNNPLIIDEVNDIDAAIYLTIRSSYITAGQRCTAARRLIVIDSKETNNYLKKLIQTIKTIKIGPYTIDPEPFMGPVISNQAADNILNSYQDLLSLGAEEIIPLGRIEKNLPFLSPGLIEVTTLKNRKDEEIFGPLLQVIRVKNFEEALIEANKTSYGLVAGLLSENKDRVQQFINSIKTGVFTWNRPTTNINSALPFGGIGHSGNHRPSGYYAIDYCVYPVGGVEKETLSLPEVLLPGITL